MALNEPGTYYEILEVAPDASPQEIRAAYLRVKSAYHKDSVALYTLITEEETATYLKLIEEAYIVLSSPEKRKQYDRRHGLMSIDEDFLGTPRPPRNQKIVSIDRVPPMEDTALEPDLLVAPKTDFGAHAETEFGGGATSFRQEAAPGAAMPLPPTSGPIAGSGATVPTGMRKSPEVTVGGDGVLAQEIAQETEWRGSFIRKVRETRQVSLEELSDYTKITKSYITAIEEENFARLPAPVYLRGFVLQIAKALKLPHDKVASAYMSHYYKTTAVKSR